MIKKFRALFTGTLRSYSQVFFSDHLAFAVLLLLVTFFDWHSGLAGLLSVAVSHALSYSLGLDNNQIRKGAYGFNALLTGLGLAFFHGPSPVFFLVVAIGAAISLLLSVTFQGLLGKYGLPFLSLPFIFSLWILNLGAVEFSYLGLSERGVFSFNYLFGLGGKNLLDFVLWWDNLGGLSLFRTYFKSLAAILFMQDILPGVIISLGLLLYSRMAFSLSIIGFAAAFGFYQIIGADFSSLNYSYIGFNYVLTSIALGGFFLVPSWRSYLTSILIIPLVATFSIGFSHLLVQWHLPVYALPFNLTVLLILYVLKMRTNQPGKLREVYIQHNSPEKNFYAVRNFIQRFENKGEVFVGLPFFGSWTVNQGHNGALTHRGGFQHAWDFVVVGDDGSEYSGDGNFVTDYYCYNQQVTAPADGMVEQVENDVADNLIGDTNLQENWGNSIVVKAGDFLYYQVSHLKPGSVEVKAGDKVKKGQILARCGNSGRSPYPHLHFQIQETPNIGSPTIKYAISNYLMQDPEGRKVVTYCIPELGDTIENIYPQPLLKKAFMFKPGQLIEWNVDGAVVAWDVKTTIYNKTFMECRETQAKAWFENDGAIFWFTHFEGKRDSLLYYFFLAAFKVPLTFDSGLEVTDQYPLNIIYPKTRRWIQDFIAPFHVFLKGSYRSVFKDIDDETFPSSLKIVASTIIQRRETGFYKITINQQGIHQFQYQWKNKGIKTAYYRFS